MSKVVLNKVELEPELERERERVRPKHGGPWGSQDVIQKKSSDRQPWMSDHREISDDELEHPGVHLGLELATATKGGEHLRGEMSPRVGDRYQVAVINWMIYEEEDWLATETSWKKTGRDRVDDEDEEQQQQTQTRHDDNNREVGDNSTGE
ncbi:hypothetical protein RUM44_002140 [Polyplax serrata]|uniref:Uncharacterized protein n=1 Tax=Polyplax serrata TaxID=468196 RepID=A0ABR1ANJ8_POLSC